MTITRPGAPTEVQDRVRAEIEIAGTGLFNLVLDERFGICEIDDVACHEHGTVLSGFLPSSWDHLDCQSWDHPARLAGGSSVCPLNRHVVFIDKARAPPRSAIARSLPMSVAIAVNPEGLQHRPNPPPLASAEL